MPYPTNFPGTKIIEWDDLCNDPPVSRYLLDRMAVMGKGAVAYIGLQDDSARAVDLFYERISHPAMTDVKIDFGGLRVRDLYPAKLPDLFVGRPILVTGRFEGNSTGSITLHGKIGGHSRRIEVPVISDEYPTTNPGIAAVWARKKIESLAMRALADNNDTSSEIKRTALTYNLVSSYTAFVAVDSSTRTQGDHGMTVSVPVPVPDGVRYDTTVQE